MTHPLAGLFFFSSVTRFAAAREANRSRTQQGSSATNHLKRLELSKLASAPAPGQLLLLLLLHPSHSTFSSFHLQPSLQASAVLHHSNCSSLLYHGHREPRPLRTLSVSHHHQASSFCFAFPKLPLISSTAASRAILKLHFVVIARVCPTSQPLSCRPFAAR